MDLELHGRVVLVGGGTAVAGSGVTVTTVSPGPVSGDAAIAVEPGWPGKSIATGHRVHGTTSPSAPFTLQTKDVP
ncbi:hypothetical protein [Kineosporia sp. NBRC 101731]|uniref:hypothetical protein n=1 Tax=Kineosporia sp. NBRC 101731 TaxID=3032199 RepID=UPI002553C499|nr:hypothetical protein [Kineosporia sp. NBRC 101731]